MKNRKSERLEYWKSWAARNEAALGELPRRMDEREALYRGEVREIKPLTLRDRQKDGRLRKTVHLRNIVAENIESEVSSTIPQPKVTAKRQSDEGRAKILEDMLRNELDRLPMETLNDMMERTVPIQGGGYWLVEWDNSKRTASTVGDVAVSILHPKQVIPQDGVFGSVEDMDAIVLKLPQTRSYIKRVYGKDVSDESEEAPEARTLDEHADTAEDMVTQYVAYYRNEDGGIGRFSWVGDAVLEDMEDYEARRVRKCEACGEIITAPGEKTCPTCGAEVIKEGTEEAEEVFSAIRTAGGTEIPGAAAAVDEAGLPAMQPTRLPYYKPDVFPVFLQKNVSVYGQLLGDSDVDKIADQQNTVNRMEQKIIDRLVKAGTRITLPPDASYRMDTEDNEVIRLKNVQDRQYIATYNFEGNVQNEMAYLNIAYEEARQILGITNSFQGRADRTATSGVAKEFQAAQSAGRLESKRVMKAAAYAELFELMFKFQLAYSDEPRSVSYRDHKGDVVYETFNRYDFLKQDADGAWYWNDDFLFSVDSNEALEANRTAMWQETRMNLQTGAFGNPGEIETLILFWSKMEELHYPGAGATRKYLEERREAQAQQAGMMQMLQGAPEGLPSAAGTMRPEESGEQPELKSPSEIRDNLNMATAGLQIP